MKKITIITPRKSIWNLQLSLIWEYRDLLIMFIKRDYITYYKQSLLGPLWFIIEPILLSLVFTIIFGVITGIPTDGLPVFVFYLSGVTCWIYFAENLLKISNTYRENRQIFSKVYFPRIVIPLAIVISNLWKLLIQLVILILFVVFHQFSYDFVAIIFLVCTLPILILNLALLSLSIGLIVTSITSKYRDLLFVLPFAIQLWMFATPIIYPLSFIKTKSPLIASLIEVNPMTHIIENFRLVVLRIGEPSIEGLLYNTLILSMLFCVSVMIFNRRDNNIMDTV